MNVLYLMTNFPRWEGDVHSPWAVELIHRLRARGVHITVCAPAYKGLGDHAIAGIPVKRFRYAPAPWETLTHESGAPNKIRRNPLYLLLLPGYLLAGGRRVSSLCKAGRWDAIHVHWPIPQGFLALAAGAPRGVPLISTFYGADLALVRKYPLLSPLLQRVVERSVGVTAISRHTGRILAELTGRQPTILPYGMDLRRRPAAPASASGAGYGILTVGRLIERKGHAVLIRAMRRLVERGREAHLTIIGEGQERPRLEAMIRELGLTERVQLLGRVPDGELERAYARCDAFVLPSIVDAGGDTEGLGMVLLEALRYERPVIASALGGITDIVEHERSGLLVPPADPEALAGAIERLMDDPGLAGRLGEQGRRINAERFDWERILDAYLALYRGEDPGCGEGGPVASV